MSEEIPRADHLAWCKKRALELCDAGEVSGAWMSFVSDLQKHPYTRNHIGTELGNVLYFGGHLSQPGQMREFI